MAGVHDYLNFLKRGIGRASVHASEDVRRGLITREQGFDLIKQYDVQRPHALDYYKKNYWFYRRTNKKNYHSCKKKKQICKQIFKIKILNFQSLKN